METIWKSENISLVSELYYFDQNNDRELINSFSNIIWNSYFFGTATANYLLSFLQ